MYQGLITWGLDLLMESQPTIKNSFICIMVNIFSGEIHFSLPFSVMKTDHKLSNYYIEKN